MQAKRWLRIIPVALVMYTIAYVDRTNVSLSLDSEKSSMMRELGMDAQMKGQAAGIFFIGYLLLQIPGGFLATHWSAKRFISILLVLWGGCAVACGYVHSFNQFLVMRFFLGIAESGVFPAVLVLLAHWFPRSERARANAFWNLCQPLSVAFSAPITSMLLHGFGWRQMIIAEGALPFIWLPIWLYFISDHPHKAKWISDEEREHLETTLAAENASRPQSSPKAIFAVLPSVLVMVVIYFFHNCAAYGCMTFLTDALKSDMKLGGFMFGVLFAIPYLVTAVIMIVISHLSDRTGARRPYVALVYAVAGTTLIASVLIRPYNFWISYVLLCFAVQGPFSALAPFWAIPGETLPKGVMGAAMGLVNAIGNLGGFVGPTIVGIIQKSTGGGIAIPFSVLGGGLLVAAALTPLLPRKPRSEERGFPVVIPTANLASPASH